MRELSREPITDETDITELTSSVTGVVCVQKVDELSEYRLLEDPVNGAIHMYIGDGTEAGYQEWIRGLVQ